MPEQLTADVRFTLADAQAAGDSWGYNCGPAALCAVLGKTPDEIRPHLLDFESKGYTNPTLMAHILRDLGVKFRRKYECQAPFDGRPMMRAWPRFGLVRIQWGGPWTNQGVPMAARYRHTHWIAHRLRDRKRSPYLPPIREAFDVNALCVGGWLPFTEWANELVPWLLKQVEPKGNGEWWPTHCWEIEQ